MQDDSHDIGTIEQSEPDMNSETTVEQEQTPSAAEKPAGGRKRKSLIREYIEAIVVALILALVLRAYVVEAFKIPSGSMVKTLLIGDHLLVNKLLYGLDLPFKDDKIFVYRQPRLYDIIVFKYPQDPSKNFIKRVIGTPGDKVEIIDKRAYVNDKETNHSFVNYTDSSILPGRMSKRDNYGPVIVPEGKVFVMGDNRDDSHDSRFWGFVGINEIKGKAMFIYWSWDGDESSVRFNRIGRGLK